jgi:pteridine reductase
MSRNSLSEKTVFITGGAKRLGAAMARVLHEAGANLVLHYHKSRDQAEALADELQTIRPDSVVLVQADLLDMGALHEAARQAEHAFGSLDVLINNASSFYPTPLGNITGNQWDDLIGTNLKAPLFLSQALAPALAKREGLILNMVDIHARRPMREHTVYCVAKAGLSMLTMSLARELGPTVRVNGIAPGAILWPEADLPQATRDKIIDETVLGRCGSPEDIARAAMFYISEAPYVTGQILAVDGGRSLGW